MTKKRTGLILICISLLIILVSYLLGPIPSTREYHQFADQKIWLEIPYTLNVLSNAAIAIPGFIGTFLLLKPSRIQFNEKKERWFWLALSYGLILTAIGSSYYHLAPDNFRLVFDRLPMTFVFMTLVAALIGERINVTLGLILWPILIIIGFCSVFQWYFSELKGHSDLRFYLSVQAFAIAITFIMGFSQSSYDKNYYLFVVVICYLIAILFDRFDLDVYKITDKTISGHTLKHLMIGLASFLLIEMIWHRKRV